MPRSLAACAVIFVGGCFFDADYRGGTYSCPDGLCPAGLSCNAQQVCVAGDGGPEIDAPDARDAPGIDARIPAFTCADPGLLPPTGGVETGTTEGKPFGMSSLCGGFTMNGRDAVYKLTVPAGKRLTVSILEGDRNAYVIASCIASPSTPPCLGNASARLANPISVMPAAGDVFVVVDDEFATGEGPYRLEVLVGN